jgi:predicted RNA binding protein YcfA (HicA-like mRNA interferase family)
MAKLPSLTARKVVRALKRAGFIEDRQKGSHLILIHPETKARTVLQLVVSVRSASVAEDERNVGDVAASGNAR